MTETKIKIITENRKARHDYNIVEAMEAGMELVGTEVKSLRAGKVNLKDSFVRITKKGELVVMNMHISPYDFGNYNNHDPLRTRRLLMHRREIDRLLGHGFVKMELALCTGKKIYDKRRDMADRDAKREMQRVIKERNKF